MRKIMAILMAMVVLAGICAVTPAVAVSDALVDETFEGDLSAWTIVEGDAQKATIVGGGVAGNALQLTGSADTDVIKLRKKIKYAGQTPYEISSNYKVVAHEGGLGFRIYMQDTSPNVRDLLGESDYVTAVSESGYKNMAFGARYYWTGEREAYVIIEYTGKGAVLVDNVAVENKMDGVIPNGDFEADTYSSKDVTIEYETGKTIEMGYARDTDGNGYAYTKGAGWNSKLTMKYGRAITQGETYMISFRYKTENTSAVPCLYVYYSDSENPAKGESLLDYSIYHPSFADVTDGKVKVTPSTKWQTYYAIFRVPTNEESGTDYALLHNIQIRSNSKDAVSCFDDICITKAGPKMEYTNTSNTPVQSIPAANTTLRTRCFYPKTSTAEADDVMLISAIYEEDANNARKLVAVNVQSQSITANQNIIAVNTDVPTVTTGKTLVAESFLWSGKGALTSKIDKITLN